MCWHIVSLINLLTLEERNSGCEGYDDGQIVLIGVSSKGCLDSLKKLNESLSTSYVRYGIAVSSSKHLVLCR